MKKHSCILHFKGYAIIVEDYIYKLQINPTKTFLTMTDIINHINTIERNFNNVVGPLKMPPNEEKTSH